MLQANRLVDGAAPVADVDEVARTLLRDGMALPGVIRVGLALTRGAGRELTFTASDRAQSGAEVEWCTIDGLADVPLTQAVRQGSGILLRDVDALYAGYPGMADRQVALGTRALAAYPLRDGGTVHGGVLLSFGSRQSFGPDQQARLGSLAARTATALTTARQRSRRLALGSHGRGPWTLPATPAVALGQHHRLAAEAPVPRGDDVGWVEAVDLGDGSVLLAAGVGPDAGNRPADDGTGEPGVVRAAIAARRAVRGAAAAAGGDPAAVLDRLDDVLGAGGSAGAASAATSVVVLDPVRRRLVAATAGGPPVAVLRPDGARLLDLGGAPQGAIRPGRAGRRTTSVELAAEDAVVLLSHPGLDRAALVAALDRLAPDLPDPLLLALLLGREPLGPTPWSALAARLPGPAGAHRVVLDLPDDATAPRVGRRQVARQLDCWGAGDLTDVARACVSELCTNALMHSATGARVVAALDARRAVVLVHNGGTGEVGRADPDEDGVGGRGLMLVEALASRWGWQVGAEGTTVWFEVDRP